MGTTDSHFPYLTADFPGVGGTIKQRPEDFFVQELPLYMPSGEGEHLYCEIEKVGKTTFQLLRRIQTVLGVRSQDIGYAGLKDAHAVTRQLVSIRGADPQSVQRINGEGFSVRWAVPHRNKLRRGHLAGNRFAVRIREVNPTDVVRLRPILNVLERRGVPNYFGPQRFGMRQDNHLLGLALLRGEPGELLQQWLGRPGDSDSPGAALARASFDRGEFEEAARSFPAGGRDEIRALRMLAEGERAARVVAAIYPPLKELWLSAAQSWVFNRVLAARVDTLDKLLEGDVARKESNGACFAVADPRSEQVRCDAFEISPTGPLPGPDMLAARGEIGVLEARVFAECSLPPVDRWPGWIRVSGARRSLRARLSETTLAAGVDEHGAHITVAFTLPAGSFATALIRELSKSPMIDRPVTQPEESSDAPG